MKTDREILRELAKEYAQIAADESNKERIKLHTAVNDLKQIRPVVLMEELPWHELNYDGALTLHCTDELCQSAEQHMRRTLFKWRHMRADMIVEPFIPVPKVVYNTGVGLTVKEHVLSKNDGNNIISHEYKDQLQTDADLERIQIPKITYDAEETQRRVDILNEMIGDIIPIKTVGVKSYVACWDDIARYRGVTSILMDLIDRPEHSHRIIEKFAQAAIAQNEQYEALNLLEPHPYNLHCTAAMTSDLPGDDFDENHVKLKNVWGRGMAQIFGSVSREMHEEFDTAYMKKIMEPFGLVYYGCCEPLHKKIDIIEQIPHLRKISITPWADVEEATEIIGRRYVVASKPNPASVGVANFDKQAVQAELKKILSACKKNNCSADLVLKDISSVAGHPENLFMWEEIAMDLVCNY